MSGEQPPSPSPVRVQPLHVAPGPHAVAAGTTARRMMLDVLIALAPVLAMAIWVFRWYAVFQVALAVASCLAAEELFARMRGRRAPLDDLSAAVTGAIFGLSLPWSAPWHVAVIGSFAAIGLGKAVYGGLGQNLFNPAMVGRAFVMVAFASSLSGAAYTRPEASLLVLTQATPLSAAKEAAGAALPGLWPLLLGTVNGSLGETSVLACLLGGVYLCVRRAASWEIPLAVLGGASAAAALHNLLAPATPLTVFHHLAAGALLFAAVYIATDPVSSPLTRRGKAIYGAGIGILIVLIRVLSSYPEGVVFAVLLMNAGVPLINRATIPTPFGGAPEAAAKGAR